MKLIARLTIAGHIIERPKKKAATVIAGSVIIAPAINIIFIDSAPRALESDAQSPGQHGRKDKGDNGICRREGMQEVILNCQRTEDPNPSITSS
jgi:hypothetical protein